MATLVGKENDALEMLKNLIELDYDAVEAYQVATQKISDPTSKDALSAFQRDHERHTVELSQLVRQLGASPPGKGDVKRLLTQGKVQLGALMGDRAILQAMKTNEDDTNTAYERATSRNDLPPGAADLVQRGLADERRHREWIVARIERLERGEAAGAQPGT